MLDHLYSKSWIRFDSIIKKKKNTPFNNTSTELFPIDNRQNSNSTRQLTQSRNATGQNQPVDRSIYTRPIADLCQRDDPRSRLRGVDSSGCTRRSRPYCVHLVKRNGTARWSHFYKRAVSSIFSNWPPTSPIVIFKWSFIGGQYIEANCVCAF